MLRINGTSGGATRSLTIGIGQPVSAALDAAPSGPNPGACVLYAWRNASANERTLTVGGTTIGCVEDPTPDTGGTPQPFRCLMGSTPIAATCGSVIRFASPASVPWSVSRPNGSPRRASFILQGVIADNASATAAHLGITNASFVTIQ